MKVKELIEKLLKEDQEATVVKTSDNFELNGATVEVNGFYSTTATKVKRNFRDAFDGESYDSDVWSLLSNGDTKIIKI
jgi:hypothetical protein